MFSYFPGAPGLRLPSILPFLRIFARAVRMARVVHGIIVFAISLSAITSTPCNLLMMTFSSSVRCILDNLGAIWAGWKVEVQWVKDGWRCVALVADSGRTIFRQILCNTRIVQMSNYTVWISVNNTVWVPLTVWKCIIEEVAYAHNCTFLSIVHLKLVVWVTTHFHPHSDRSNENHEWMTKNSPVSFHIHRTAQLLKHGEWLKFV